MNLRSYIRKLLSEEVSDATPGKKMIFMAGAPGSGKSTVLKQIGIIDQFSIINPDDWYEPFLIDAGISLNVGEFTQRYFDIIAAIKEGKEAGLDTTELEEKRAELRPTMSENMKLFSRARKLAAMEAARLSTEGKDFIIDGTGGNFRQIANLNLAYRDLGYLTAMIYVSIPEETSVQRNDDRGKQGKRRIHPSAVRKSHQSVSSNLQSYSDLFGSNFFAIDNSGSFEEYQNNIEKARESIEVFLNPSNIASSNR